MRILRVAGKYYPDVTGGGAYHVHALSRDQAAMGHDVTVLTIRRGDTPRHEHRDGYTVVRRRPSVSALGNELSIGLARELWQVDDVDVVHAHSHLYASTNLAALRRRLQRWPALGRQLADAPLAITNHGLYSQSAPRWLFDLYLRTLGRATFDSADLVFCYTDADRRRLRARGVSTDVAVVPNGIDETRFAPDGEESEAFDADGPVVLFVGRLVEGKRPADAVDAFARLADDYPTVRLSLVGDGPRRSALERRVAAAGLADRVSFLGQVPYDRMPAVYRAADLLVLPSESEGFPRTVLEALATGTPVVTTDLPQLRGLTDRGILAVPVGEVEALAASMADLLDDGARRKRLGRAGRDLVEDRYTWAGTVRETTDRLATLCE